MSTPKLDRRLRLLLSYAPDWIITILVAGLFYLLNRIHGFWRNFSLTDTSIQYPYTLHERVPSWLLVILCFVCPLVIMPVINIISIRSWWDLHNSWLGLVLSLALTGTVTNLVKVTAGRPRPDLISRCQPMARVQNAPVFGLVTADICTQTDFGILKDGFRSFFSGHSSLSFAGLGFLFFYTAGKLHLFDHRGHAGKAWIAFIPLVGATLIAITRTMDYRHHPVDVLVGSVVGLVIAHFCYRQYYPSLMHPLSHRPYSPRIPRDEVEETPVTKQADVPQAGPSAPWGTGLASNAAAETGMEPGPDDTVQRGNTELEKVWKTGSNGDDTVPRPAERQGQGRV